MKSKLMAFAVIPAALLMGSATANAAPATLGALFEFNGTLGVNPVNGSIYDGDIHSGVSRSANGTSSDSYVLQGGDPFGGDTGDGFEETQAPGHAVVGFFDIFTHYVDNSILPAVQAGTFIAGAPDTGYLEIQNNTADEFIGTIKLSGQAFGGIYGPAQFFSNSGGVDLKPGDVADIVLNNESSNYGGYNHPDAIPDGGTTFAMLGVGLLGLFGFARRSARA